MARAAVSKGLLGKVGAEVGVYGVDDIKKAIAAKLSQMTGMEAKRVFMRAAMVMVVEAKDLAPKKSGLLRDAIYAAYGDPRKPNVIVGVNYRKAPHAHWEEYGHIQTGHGGRGKGRGIKFIQGSAFMRRSLVSARPTMAATIAEGLKALVEADYTG
jgi:hypothetical protein